MSIPRKIPGEDYVHFFPDEGDGCFAMEICGISYCPAQYAITRVDSPIYVFEYVCCGSGVFQTNGLEFSPAAGDVYMAHAGLTHTYRTNPRDPWVKVYFNVSGTLVDALMNQYSLESTFYLENSGLGEVFLNALSMIRHNLDHAQEASVLALHKVIFQIAQVRKERSETALPSRLLEIRRHLDASVFQSVSMDAIAKKFGFSTSQFNRVFRAGFGRSPYHYLLEQKLRTAELMLAHTGKTVKDIAGELCFADEYYFSNFFRKKRGISPNVFRRKTRSS